MNMIRMALAAVCLAFTTIPFSANARDLVVRATWYGARYQGRRMTCGERFDRRDPTTAAANRRLGVPLGARIRVTNRANGRSLDMVVRDVSPHAALDLSEAAAEALGYKTAGSATLVMTIIP